MCGELATVALPLFLSGHYDEAVLVAIKQVDVVVRTLGKYTNEDLVYPSREKRSAPPARYIKPDIPVLEEIGIRAVLAIGNVSKDLAMIFEQGPR